MIDCRSLALAALMLGLAGCATTEKKYEAPPEVIEQPRQITADEAVAEGEAALAQDVETGLDAELTERGVPEAQPAGEAPPAPTPSPQSAQKPDRSRYRPTDRSTEDIRTLHQNTAPPLDFGQRLDHAHDWVYTRSQGMVEATDHHFAPKDQELLPVPAAPFRLATMMEFVNHSDGLGVDIDIDLDIALRLPNIEKRLKVFVTSSELDESPNTAGGDPQLRAGLRYELKRDIDFDLGVRVDWPPVAFASVKWTRQFDITEKWSFYPLAKLFAETEESLGYAAAITFDRWSGRNLLRSSTYTKWRMDRDTNEWSQTLVYARAHQLIAPDRYGSFIAANDIGIGWGVRLFGKDEGTFEGKDATEYYEAGIFYRKPTKNRWLYWHFEPIVRWDKKYNWATDLGVRLGVDMLFWDLARPAH